jgi:hypothetical protein
MSDDCSSANIMSAPTNLVAKVFQNSMSPLDEAPDVRSRATRKA